MVSYGTSLIRNKITNIHIYASRYVDFLSCITLSMPLALGPVSNRIEELGRLLQKRIVIIDGAMGTMVQQHRLDEAAYRGERFKNWHKDLKGLHDLLNVTRPEVIEGIHRQ